MGFPSLLVCFGFVVFVLYVLCLWRLWGGWSVRGLSRLFIVCSRLRCVFFEGE